MKGTIRNLETRKAFGFISVKGLDDHFFHKDDFLGHWADLLFDYLKDKEIELEFESVETPKGMRANNVRRVGHPNES